MRWLLLCGLLNGVLGCSLSEPADTAPDVSGSNLEGATPAPRDADAKAAAGGKAPSPCTGKECEPSGSVGCSKPVQDEDVCADVKVTCMAKGVDGEQCEVMAKECKGPGKPAAGDCGSVRATCSKQGLDPKTCEVIATACKEPTANTPDVCAEQLKTCYAKGLDPAICESVAVGCKHTQAPDRGDSCKQKLIACQSSKDDPERCQAIAAACEEEASDAPK